MEPVRANRANSKYILYGTIASYFQLSILSRDQVDMWLAHLPATALLCSPM